MQTSWLLRDVALQAGGTATVTWPIAMEWVQEAVMRPT